MRILCPVIASRFVQGHDVSVAWKLLLCKFLNGFTYSLRRSSYRHTEHNIEALALGAVFGNTAISPFVFEFIDGFATADFAAVLVDEF